MYFKHFSKFLCVLLAAGCVLNVSGCGKKADSGSATGSAVENAKEENANTSLFIKAYLDTMCKQDFQSFADATGSSASDIQNSYSSNLASILSEYVTYEIGSGIETALTKELSTILGKCQYTVQDPIANEDDTVTVPVSIKPLVIFKKAIAYGNKESNKWTKKHKDDFDEEEATNKFFMAVIDSCDKQLQDPTYKEETVVNVTMTPSEDDEDVYEYNSEDLGKLLSTLVDLDAWADEVDDEDSES